MTVCVATMFGRTDTAAPRIIGACDRLLSNAVFKYQPSTKIYFTKSKSLVFMIAGDPALERELLAELSFAERAWIAANPGKLWPLKQLANSYRISYAEAKRKRVEAKWLIPNGLNSYTWVSRNRELSTEFARDLRSEIDGYRLPAIQTIIAGFDEDGAHLYVADDGEIDERNADACAVIGAGAIHAITELAIVGHTVEAEPAAALLSTYAAKKRAELAPSVGSDTDMFIFGPGPGSYTPLDQSVVQGIDAVYRRWARGEQVGWKRALRWMSDDLAVRAAQQATPPKPPDGPAPEHPPSSSNFS